MPFATNPEDGVRIYYEDVGTGPPLVLHHGTSLDHRSWSRVFGRDVSYADLLSRHHRLLLLDARGHGRSDKPREQSAYAMPKLAADVVAVLDDAACGSAHFMGYSMGGRVGFGIGCYEPLERFRSLIIGAASYINPSNFPVPDEILNVLATGTMEDYIRAQEEHRGVRLSDDRRQSLVALDPQAYLAYLRQTFREPSTETSLERMKLPVLLFAGERDQGGGPDLPAIGRAVADQLPNAEFFAIPGKDHNSAYFETDLILSQVEAFLSRVEARE